MTIAASTIIQLYLYCVQMLPSYNLNSINDKTMKDDNKTKF